MQTWIVNIEADEAKIFAMPEGDTSLHPVAKHKRHGNRQSIRTFLRYIAEELEIACGAGTDSHVILLAPPNLTRMLKRVLSPEVKSRLVEDLGDWFTNTWTKARLPKSALAN